MSSTTWKKRLLVLHTVEEPPNWGSTSRAIIGWTTKRRPAPTNEVSAKMTVTAVELRAGGAALVGSSAVTAWMSTVTVRPRTSRTTWAVVTPSTAVLETRPVASWVHAIRRPVASCCQVARPAPS